MAGKHILIIEDEQKIASLLKEYLEKSGFKTTMLGRGDLAAAQVRKIAPDLVLLDIMLPGLDGMAVCREIRQFSAVPIIMITARVDEVDRLIGLELGADDYVCKPFSPREVVARVKAVLRRSGATPAEKKVALGPISLDETAHQARIGAAELDLTPSEFRLLQVLLSHPGRVFSRDELLSRVQGYECEGYDRTIDSHIKNLRKKMSVHLPGADIITTVYGVGYKLNNFPPN